MSKEKSEVVFRLKNNDRRSYGFANGLCVAGTGNPTPPESAKQNVFLPDKYELSEEQMWRSWRGVVAAMREGTPHGKPAIEVFIPGAQLQPDHLESWADEYREKKGLPKPETPAEHGREVEKAMNRPEDPIETNRRHAEQQRNKDLVLLILDTLEARDAQKAAAAAKTK